MLEGGGVMPLNLGVWVEILDLIRKKVTGLVRKGEIVDPEKHFFGSSLSIP